MQQVITYIMQISRTCWRHLTDYTPQCQWSQCVAFRGLLAASPVHGSRARLESAVETSCERLSCGGIAGSGHALRLRWPLVVLSSAFRSMIWLARCCCAAHGHPRQCRGHQCCHDIEVFAFVRHASVADRGAQGKVRACCGPPQKRCY